MRVLYFGWVRAKIGIGSEEIDLPKDVDDVRALIHWLGRRGGGYNVALRDETAIRVAVNQELADLDSPIVSDDEVALFPPMTGG